VILASLVPLVLFGLSTYKTERNTYKKEIVQNLKTISHNKKNDILDYFHTIKFEVSELRNNIHFFQEQGTTHIQNIQQLQAQNIMEYYQSLEKNLISLANQESFHSFNALKNALTIENLFIINAEGNITYATDKEYKLLGHNVVNLTHTFTRVWQKLQHKQTNEVYVVDFAYEKLTKSYKQYMITSLRHSDGYVVLDIDNAPIDKILQNVDSLGKTAESYLIYKSEDNATTFLASNRVVKHGRIGDVKLGKQINKGFINAGVEIKYGSTGAIELVGYMPIHYKNMVRSLQTTVRYIDVVSPTIKKTSYFEAFVKDYRFHNLILVSSKGNIIYSLEKHKNDVERNILSSKYPNHQFTKIFQNVLKNKHYYLSDTISYKSNTKSIAQFASAPLFNANNDVEIVVFLELNHTLLDEILHKDIKNYYKTLNLFLINKKLVKQNQALQLYKGENIYYDSIHLGAIDWEIVSKIDTKELDSMTYTIKKDIIIFIMLFSILAIIIILSVSYYKKKHDEKLLFSATHDSLTQLPNRHFVFDFLEYILANASRKKMRGAILFMDLDNFKFINDSYGHEIGDFVLVEVASRLKKVLRQDEVLARLGGDEFLVIINSFTTISELDAICKRIIAELSLPLQDAQHFYQIGVSIGIAIFPDDSNNAKELLQFADTAMYKTKEEGRNNFTYYSKELTQHSLNTSRVTKDLRYAIEHDELRLHYQPQIDIQTQKIVGVEALVRWEHSQDGLIMPNDFIPIAEESHLIIDLGEWVIKKACSDFKSWKESGYDLEYIAVNMSAKQLGCDRCSTYITNLLKVLDFNPLWLELEITENTLIENYERVTKNIEMFKELGIRFSIDDFGTGYSSLTYLKSLQISTLKIDREFIKDILIDKDDLSIVKAVIDMGHALHYKIIAEGAEDEESVAVLDTLGCDVIQGYVYAKPLKEIHLLEFMDTNKKRLQDVK
jgi:diguanylate cyclase (GGDEF)-like protein